MFYSQKIENKISIPGRYELLSDSQYRVQTRSWKKISLKFLEFLPIFKAFFPERCLDLGTYFPE